VLAAIEKHLPAVAEGLARIDRAAAAGQEERALAEVFPALPSVSIDYGVMEKADRIAVVPGSFGWNDVGSWQVSWEMAARDAQGNVLPPGTIAIDAHNNLVRDLTTDAGGGSWEGSRDGSRDGSRGGMTALSKQATKKRWALVGVSDLVIVETDDAVLVIPRTRSQDVRLVVDTLSARGETERL
jgi:mannose-1-phosphate guanylyltransferase